MAFWFLLHDQVEINFNVHNLNFFPWDSFFDFVMIVRSS